MKKLIKINDRVQVVTSRGYCRGPVVVPFWEQCSFILGMISINADVVEVLPDRSEVKLTLDNFDKDNTVLRETRVRPEIPRKPRQEVEVKEFVQKDIRNRNKNKQYQGKAWDHTKNNKQVVPDKPADVVINPASEGAPKVDVPKVDTPVKEESIKVDVPKVDTPVKEEVAAVPSRRQNAEQNRNHNSKNQKKFDKKNKADELEQD